MVTRVVWGLYLIAAAASAASIPSTAAAATTAIDQYATRDRPRPTLTTAYDIGLHLHARQLVMDPESACLEQVGALVSCLEQNCVDEPCEPTNETLSPPDGDCDSKSQEICNRFDTGCCPPCTQIAMAYLDCSVSTALFETCPDSPTCSSRANTTVTTTTAAAGPSAGFSPAASGSNDTALASPATTTAIAQEDSPEREADEGEMVANATTAVPPSAAANKTTEADSSEATTAATTETTEAPTQPSKENNSCADAIGEMVLCILGNCFLRNCETDPAGTDSSGPGGPWAIDDCQSFQTEYCAAFDATDQCCPECSATTTKYLDCFLQTTAAEYCPGATCDLTNKMGSLIVQSKSGGGDSTHMGSDAATNKVLQSKESSSSSTSASLSASSSFSSSTASSSSSTTTHHNLKGMAFSSGVSSRQTGFALLLAIGSLLCVGLIF